MTAGPTFGAFVAGPWRAACHERCKLSTRIRVDGLLRTQLLPRFGELPLDAISRRVVRSWFDDYSHTAPAGANRALDVLRQVFNFGIASGVVTANPTRGLRRNPRPRPTRFLSRDEIRRLHAALTAHRGRGSGSQQAEIIRLLLLTGCRRGEIVRLRWSEVGGEGLHLTDSKTGPRTVLLNAPARAVLARQPRGASPWVFPSRADPARHRPDELSLWRKVRREARLPDVRLHDLRHTFASHAVLRGAPLPVVSRLLGHSRPRMTLRYAHVSDRETEAAAERIGVAMAAALAGRVAPLRRGSADPSGRTAREVAKVTSARELRQSLGEVLDGLEGGGKPILVCRRQNLVAALVSLKDYRERFSDHESRPRSFRGLRCSSTPPM